MGWFETIDGDGSIATIDRDGKVFVSSFDDGIGSIIGRLEGFANTIISYEHMCGCG